MAVSKRLRYEILRRDNHPCRYCGAMAPDVPLTVDHVTPTALGGTDEPSNLVTACQDCNAGKASVRPGDQIVEDVQADALRWARAIEAAAHNMLADRELITDLLDRFEAVWNTWTHPVEVTVPAALLVPTGDVLADNWHRFGWITARHARPVAFADGVLSVQVERGYVTDVRRELGLVRNREELANTLGALVERVEVVPGWVGALPQPPQPTRRTEHHTYPLPGGWQQSVERFFAVGLPEEEVHRLIRVAIERPGIVPTERFRFFCGCCWRAVTDLQEDARRLIVAEQSQEDTT